MTRPDQTALITGASSGIGRAVAEVLAARGYNLVLVARREDRLIALKAQIEQSHPVQVTLLTVDLARDDSAEQIFLATQNAGIRISLLVNNAGYAITGRYASIDWTQQAALIQVLATSPAQLIHRYLPAMLEAGYGRVMNVASVGAFMPGMPGMTLYAGLKQFVMAMTHSLGEEYRDTGVSFTTLCPGATETEWAEKSGASAPYKKLPKRLVQSARDCAEGACNAMLRGERLVVTGFPSRLGMRLSSLIPESLMLRFWSRALLENKSG